LLDIPLLRSTIRIEWRKCLMLNFYTRKYLANGK